MQIANAYISLPHSCSCLQPKETESKPAASQQRPLLQLAQDSCTLLLGPYADMPQTANYTSYARLAGYAERDSSVAVLQNGVLVRYRSAADPRQASALVQD